MTKSRDFKVETMPGKVLVDVIVGYMMWRWKVDILCVQETRWNDSKASKQDSSYIIKRRSEKQTGVGVILKERLGMSWSWKEYEL